MRDPTSTAVLLLAGRRIRPCPSWTALLETGTNCSSNSSYTPSWSRIRLPPGARAIPAPCRGASSSRASRTVYCIEDGALSRAFARLSPAIPAPTMITLRGVRSLESDGGADLIMVALIYRWNFTSLTSGHQRAWWRFAMVSLNVGAMTGIRWGRLLIVSQAISQSHGRSWHHCWPSVNAMFMRHNSGITRWCSTGNSGFAPEMVIANERHNLLCRSVGDSGMGLPDLWDADHRCGWHESWEERHRISWMNLSELRYFGRIIYLTREVGDDISAFFLGHWKANPHPQNMLVKFIGDQSCERYILIFICQTVKKRELLKTIQTDNERKI